ncbi:MAG: molybdopterin-dependent oxidoreductase [Anaerolineae bacterium]|nr:molybdopterin-dependent oxidoreductase [Anaerolineae bacterium]
MKRRAFLGGSLVFLGGVIAGCRPTDTVPPTVYAPGSTLPPTAVPPTPIPATAVQLPPIPDAVPITPLKDLYYTGYRGVPEAEDVANWSLKIDGLVDHELELTMEDIKAMPVIEEMRTLCCISNPVGGALIGNIVWTGVELAPILKMVGVSEKAAYVHFEAADGYTTSLTVDRLTQDGVVLAYLANGEPLPPSHGYPLRILIPGLYGQKQPKYITRIHFADEDKLGYWEQEFRGWSNIAKVNTISQIREPSKDIPYTTPIRLAGFAFAGHEQITKIEIAIRTDKADPREWMAVNMIEPPSPRVWTWWTYDWSPPAPGLYRIAVRASDDTGFTQAQEAGTSMFAGAFPSGTGAIQEINLLLK